MILLVFVVLTPSLFAQSIPTWQRVYPEFGNAALNSIIQTSDGNFVGCGISFAYNALLIIKFDSLGNVLWSKIYSSGVGQTDGIKIREDEYGHYVVLARIELPSYNFAFWLLSLDKNQGDTLWQYFSPNDGIERYPEDFDFYSDGYIVVSTSYTINELRITKLNRNLTQFTERIYTSLPNSGFASGVGSRVKVKNDTIYIQATMSNSQGLYWSYFFKLKPNLDSVWIRRDYPSPMGPYFTFTSNYLEAVRFGTDRTIPGHQGVRIERWNLGTGSKIAENIFPSETGMFWGRPILNTSSGFVALAGYYTDPYNSLTYRMVLFFFNDNLDTLYTRWFNAPSPYNGANPRDMGKCLDGGYIILSLAQGGAVWNTLMLIKTDENGGLGLEENNETGEILKSKPEIKVFPNPSTGWLNFQIANGPCERLKIFDASGRKIKEMGIQGQLKIRLPVGIYFYQMENQTGKIVILGQ